MAIDEHPPAQFASLAQQSKTPINHFCVVTQEYDRNIYGQCNYIANRTLMRCLQIRRKEDLAKNGGQCDRHFSFRRTLKERYDRDMILIRNNCPPQSPKSRRYTRSIKSNVIKTRASCQYRNGAAKKLTTVFRNRPLNSLN